ncbi:two component transcriptional regulator, LytTR family [Tangfeifania diversioriginum]|uniref:Two component transcriptional regulator, LytTR family n=1 Tax=Tangfeifania diversioriginum TaxID=1168035 RepID=A0A1M6E947_9BACT|nr:LytTR family DNA-binding domain-containing protein [Tangfeifania diversioriginum]SHI82027.1 two component transcriptional regulator, LytTR family [Tangfeifania diversioriginum]
MISCIVIEDQMPARKILQRYIGDVNELDLKGSFSNALDAMEYLRNHQIDLIFLDIHLPKLSGIDFLTILNKKPFVIITTAFPDYALQGYELEVVDYLLKPFSFERFLKAVVKVERLTKNTSTSAESKIPESILIKEGYDFIKLKFDDITYIQADGDYSHIFCKNKKHHVSYSLKYWKDKLPVNQFIQIHRSYIVNLQLVEKTSSNYIEINQAKIPLGRVYKKKFKEAFSNR